MKEQQHFWLSFVELDVAYLHWSEHSLFDRTATNQSFCSQQPDFDSTSLMA
jgi:hypothetical protein